MKQLEFKRIKGWGGKRKKAGRKNISNAVNHMKRDKVDPKYPMLLTLKMKKGLPTLRSARISRAFKKSLAKAQKYGLRVIHFALESNHIHLFAEAKGNLELRSGMASFGSSFGRSLRKIAGGTGSVFLGRYHMRQLKTPTQTKNALAYVLLNHAKHEGSVPYPDDFSSSKYFSDWKNLLGGRYLNLKAEPLPDYLSAPRSWLACRGWQKN